MSRFLGLARAGRMNLVKNIPGQRKQPAPDRTAGAWARLQEGNQRWFSGHSNAAQLRSPQRRAELVEGQRPFAAVLSCSDSRVPPEVLFDQGLGDLFVVRTAGQAVDNAVLGSLEYAVAVLDVDLVLVLGHEKCGAIKAAAQTLQNGTVPEGYIRDVVSKLTCDMASGQSAGLADLDELSQWNADATAEWLKRRSRTIEDAIMERGTGVMAGIYELATGRVQPVRAVLSPTAPTAH